MSVAEKTVKSSIQAEGKTMRPIWNGMISFGLVNIPVGVYSATRCERLAFPFGQLRKFWPHIGTPVGRIHFAGAAYDNMPHGMDAATRP